VALIANVPGDTDPSNDAAEEGVGLA